MHGGFRLGSRREARPDGTYCTPPFRVPAVSVLQFLLDDLTADADGGGQEKRWRAVLDTATWPEVLRRMVLTWRGDDGAHP